MVVKVTKQFNYIEEYCVGDLIICDWIDPLKGNDHSPPLDFSKGYPVKNIFTDKEGNQHLDIGLISELNYIRSYETKEMLPGDAHWCHPSRFHKVKPHTINFKSIREGFIISKKDFDYLPSHQKEMFMTTKEKCTHYFKGEGINKSMFLLTTADGDK